MARLAATVCAARTAAASHGGLLAVVTLPNGEGSQLAKPVSRGVITSLGGWMLWQAIGQASARVPTGCDLDQIS